MKKLSVLLLIIALSTGCATNWNARAGKYTYQQVLSEMSRPGIETKQPNGDLKVEWRGKDVVSVSGIGKGGSILTGRQVASETFIFDPSGVLKSYEDGEFWIDGPYINGKLQSDAR